MAEIDYTTNNTDLLGLSALARLPAARGLDLHKELIVNYICDGFFEYLGTSSAIEAEGLIPPKTVWPDGFNDRRWEDGARRFWLRRERPKGVKGPRRSFLEVDWWMLRIDPIDKQSAQQTAIRSKKRDLRTAIYRASAEGVAMSNRWFRAKSDPEFMAMMAKIPGVDGK